MIDERDLAILSLQKQLAKLTAENDEYAKTYGEWESEKVAKLTAERTAAVDKWAVVSGMLDVAEADNARLREALTKKLAEEPKRS